MIDISSICQGIDLNERPILNALTTDLQTLLEFGIDEFDYRKRGDGCISKCHLRVDLRRHMAQETDEFKELRPREFYNLGVS